MPTKDQNRGVTDKIRKWLKRRAVIEPIIGHTKNEGLLGRNYLKGTDGNKINAVLAAVGFNLRQLLRFLKLLCAYIQETILTILIPNPYHLKSANS